MKRRGLQDTEVHDGDDDDADDDDDDDDDDQYICNSETRSLKLAKLVYFFVTYVNFIVFFMF